MDRTEELIRRSQDGDKAARDTLIEENMGLIHHVAKRFLGRGVKRRICSDRGNRSSESCGSL